MIYIPEEAENENPAANNNRSIENAGANTVGPAQTGDNSNLMLWIVLMVISSILLVVTVSFKRKSNSKI